MKKIAVILAALLCGFAVTYAADCKDGPYGLQVNGKTVVDAPKFGDPDAQGRAQYKASCVELKAGDVVRLINTSCDATWMVDLDPYGEYQSFEGGKSANQLTCKKEGKYDFYIKLSTSAGDLLYIGPGENCDGGTDPGDGCKDGPYGLQLNGKTVVDAPKFGDPDAQGRVQYMASCVELKAGDVVRLINTSCDATWMVDLDPYGHYENFTGGKEAGQLTCKVAGKYDFYIKLSMEEGDLVYVESSQTCGGDTPTPDPGYSTSAPAKCPDVLLQAFYWNSYEDKGYGRTKWIDHLNAKNGSSAEEIGQWFDLIWLPPMSKATGGTGYIPSKYSDLNSDWGTKAKLEQMIETFHKNGARVVADIVINHGAAWSGWWDFAQLNFGKYGTFKPDASWICKTDEMNWPEKKAEAGSCSGAASGAADDGYGSEANYDSGRDWDHTQEKVRNMFKAYLKWMRNEVKVDGFRYDYCKGFHNSHINEYNRAAEAYFSVMEMWDGNPDILQQHLNDAGWNTLTFDFATKYTAFNNGIASDNYAALKGAGLPGAGKSRYAVTFLDSHDSFQRDGNEFCGEGNAMTICKDKIMQCYAYLLSMPGVPLVFWPHWVTFKEQLKPLINARYKTGVHSESAVSDEAATNYYKATITGTNGQIRLLVGPGSGYENTPAGFTLAAKGLNYGVYIKLNAPRGDKNTERKDLTVGIEEVSPSNSSSRGEKVLRDGQLFIQVGEQVFDAFGRRVK